MTRTKTITLEESQAKALYDYLQDLRIYKMKDLDTYKACADWGAMIVTAEDLTVIEKLKDIVKESME